eukprot:1536942-Lingulodinium_polyedra.AAC.1
MAHKHPPQHLFANLHDLAPAITLQTLQGMQTAARERAEQQAADAAVGPSKKRGKDAVRVAMR